MDCSRSEYQRWKPQDLLLTTPLLQMSRKLEIFLYPSFKKREWNSAFFLMKIQCIPERARCPLCLPRSGIHIQPCSLRSLLLNPHCYRSLTSQKFGIQPLTFFVGIPIILSTHLLGLDFGDEGIERFG
uniref:Uncharacterized protein n=1 Tax=Cucumis melo TaxID=3656 RepID=A0A9I9E8J7_CUCME